MKRFTAAYHSGSLKECLSTEMSISENAFRKLIDCGLYKFYGHDDRIDADRYILSDIEHDYGLPTWLHVYGN